MVVLTPISDAHVVFLIFRKARQDDHAARLNLPPDIRGHFDQRPGQDIRDDQSVWCFMRDTPSPKAVAFDHAHEWREFIETRINTAGRDGVRIDIRRQNLPAPTFCDSKCKNTRAATEI